MRDFAFLGGRCQRFKRLRRSAISLCRQSVIDPKLCLTSMFYRRGDGICGPAEYDDGLDESIVIDRSPHG